MTLNTLSNDVKRSVPGRVIPGLAHAAPQAPLAEHAVLETNIDLGLRDTKDRDLPGTFVLDHHLFPQPGIVDLLPGQRLHLERTRACIIVLDALDIAVRPVVHLAEPPDPLAVEGGRLLRDTLDDIICPSVPLRFAQQAMLVLVKRTEADVWLVRSEPRKLSPGSRTETRRMELSEGR